MAPLPVRSDDDTGDSSPGRGRNGEFHAQLCRTHLHRRRRLVAPEYSAETAEYNEFGEAAAAFIRGGAALYPTGTATTVRVTGGKGGEVVTTDGPYAETKEVAHRLLPAGVRGPGRGRGHRGQDPGGVGRRGRGAADHPDAELARPTTPARAALVRLVRDEGRRVLATLIRLTGNLELAEDAVQDATLRALQTWPRDGVPASRGPG